MCKYLSNISSKNVNKCNI